MSWCSSSWRCSSSSSHGRSDCDWNSCLAPRQAVALPPKAFASNRRMTVLTTLSHRRRRSPSRNRKWLPRRRLSSPATNLPRRSLARCRSSRSIRRRRSPMLGRWQPRRLCGSRSQAARPVGRMNCSPQVVAVAKRKRRWKRRLSGLCAIRKRAGCGACGGRISTAAGRRIGWLPRPWRSCRCRGQATPRKKAPIRWPCSGHGRRCWPSRATTAPSTWARFRSSRACMPTPRPRSRSVNCTA